jgi:hypothetical protein
LLIDPVLAARSLARIEVAIEEYSAILPQKIPGSIMSKIFSLVSRAHQTLDKTRRPKK